VGDCPLFVYESGLGYPQILELGVPGGDGRTAGLSPGPDILRRIDEPTPRRVAPYPFEE
jgi:hypothetical protein